MYKYLDGSDWDNISTWGPTAILNDGTLLVFTGTNSDCTNNTWGAPYLNRCGIIMADLNGFKGPNTLGRDVFEFISLKTKIIPRGDSGSTDCTSGGQGVSCAYKVLTESDINY